MSDEIALPLKDLRDEARRVAAALDEVPLPLRLLGGVAIWLRCPCAEHPALRRDYADLDFLGLHSYYIEIKKFFVDLGYEPDKHFNSLHGRTRMLFYDTGNNRQVDVFLDEMRMCHILDFRSRVKLDRLTLPIADLLLTKLQIFELNPKDLNDLVTLLSDHPIGNQDGEMINGRYIAHLAANDWGIYRTSRQSLERVQKAANDLPTLGQFHAGDQARILWQLIEDEPKSLKWTLRSKIGDRIPWYEIPEEVRRS